MRYDLHLTGTHLGCEHGSCGACTVIADGVAIRSCITLAVQMNNCHIVTVEGLSLPSGLTPLQNSFKTHHALQCGFCTSGFITTLHAFLTSEPYATVDQIREAISGNICRCTGYIPIIEAALDAQKFYINK